MALKDLLDLRKTRDDLASQQQALPEPLNGLLERAEKWLADANVVVPSIEELDRLSAADRDALWNKAVDVLIRNSCIMDDEFGQRLDGRRIVVILDACHSGGFQQEQGDEPREDDEQSSNQSKGLSRGGDDEAVPFRFNFLEPQIVRLKDLGQGNTALLAAARAGESSVGGLVKSDKPGKPRPASIMLAELYKELHGLGRLDKDTSGDIEPIGVFTYYLINTLLKSGDPVGVKEAWTMSSAQMKSYFASEPFRANNESRKARNDKAILPHVPTYYDQSRPQALLKP